MHNNNNNTVRLILSTAIRFISGPGTAEEVNVILAGRKLESEFPLFTAVHNIFQGKAKATDLIDLLRSHPEYKWQS